MEIPNLITIGGTKYEINKISTKSGKPWSRTKLVLTRGEEKAYYDYKQEPIKWD